MDEPNKKPKKLRESTLFGALTLIFTALGANHVSPEITESILEMFGLFLTGLIGMYLFIKDGLMEGNETKIGTEQTGAAQIVLEQQTSEPVQNSVRPDSIGG